MNETTKPPTPRAHWTTRRGFIATAGFGGVGLYALWAAYGAAPAPWALLGLRHGGDDHGATDAGHGDAHGAGHGDMHGAQAPAPQAPDADAFRAETERFIARHRQSDGVVYPRRDAMHGQAPLHDTGHGHAQAEVAHDASHSHAMAETNEAAAAMHDAVDGGAIEVPMIAGRWYYLPAALRLDAGQDYRFRLMTMDVSHGASIQFGRGARMLRLRPGRITEVDMRFERTGRYLVTCTVYCGAAHDVMRATIEVI